MTPTDNALAWSGKPLARRIRMLGDMERHALSLALVAFALAASGCTPTPEQTCDKMAQLSEQDYYKDLKKPGKSFAKDKCLTVMEEIKARDPDAYACAAKMIKTTTSIDNAFFEIAICDKNRPRDKEVTAKGKKAKKASDDDE